MPHRPAIASMSLGRWDVHSLPEKLKQARAYGFEGIELFFEDLTCFAHRQLEHPADAASEAKGDQLLITAAEVIRDLCNKHQLKIISLQPFRNYEGLQDRAEHAAKIEELKLWFKLVHTLGTDMIGIPSTYLPPDELTGRMTDIVADLREAADLGAKESPVVRFGYESLAWGTYIDNWEASWNVVRTVDRVNFGIILDTFNIAARVYADPASGTGKRATADEDMGASIDHLYKEVDASKVFLVQLVDGERLEKPLVPGHKFYVERQPSRMTWSRNCRIFYGEADGYLPIREIADAFLHGVGFEGWWSMELFNRITTKDDPALPKQLAQRAITSWNKLVDDLDIGVDHESTTVDGASSEVG